MAEPVPGAVPGAPSPPGRSALVDWITDASRPGRTVGAAIPALYARYATVVQPDRDADKTLADAALVQVLRAHSFAQPWWLGYLDTGVADLTDLTDLVATAPVVAVYAGWPYVLLDGGPDLALGARRNADSTPWHSALPELVFSRERSWLVSTLWDDDWRCVGGPDALIDDLLRCPDLDVRAVSLEEDLAPPS